MALKPQTNEGDTSPSHLQAPKSIPQYHDEPTALVLAQSPFYKGAFHVDPKSESVVPYKTNLVVTQSHDIESCSSNLTHTFSIRIHGKLDELLPKASVMPIHKHVLKLASKSEMHQCTSGSTNLEYQIACSL